MFEIFENVVVGISILKVGVIDVDIGYNGLVQFLIIGGNLFDQFEINLMLGDFIVIFNFDREYILKYDFVI